MKPSSYAFSIHYIGSCCLCQMNKIRFFYGNQYIFLTSFSFNWNYIPPPLFFVTGVTRCRDLYVNYKGYATIINRFNMNFALMNWNKSSKYGKEANYYTVSKSMFYFKSIDSKNVSLNTENYSNSVQANTSTSRNQLW